jgi:acyl carrier protein
VDKQEILSEIAEVIRDVLDLPELSVDRGTSAENVEGWDSFNHINIVVAIEARFRIKIHTAEIEEVKNVGELVDLVAGKLSARKAV